MYGKMEDEFLSGTPTLHCMAKSAERIERKGVVAAPLRKRVRKRLKIKEIDREMGWQKERWYAEGPGGDGVDQPQVMLTRIYEFVKTTMKKGSRFLAPSR